MPRRLLAVALASALGLSACAVGTPPSAEGPVADVSIQDDDGLHGAVLPEPYAAPDLVLSSTEGTDYRLDGRTLTSYPDRSEVLTQIEPVYRTLPGWGTGLGDVREPADLPAPARALIELVEHEVGIPVRVVGVGAERDDYVIWQS